MKSQWISSIHGEYETITLCFADWLLRYNTASIAFCYRQRLDAGRLAGALQRVLRDFPAYAGRLHSNTNELRIAHGRGAVFESATRSESFETLAALAHRGKPQVVCPTLSARRALAGKQALFAVRLTETPDGSVLGVSWHHAVGDLQSTVGLLQAWSRAYAGEAYEAPPTVFDRPAYLDPRLPDPPAVAPSLRLCSFGELCALAGFLVRRKQRVDFSFCWDELAALRERLTRDAYVSTNDALCAHAFDVLRELHPLARMVLAVNYRKRIGLPSNLLGNLFSTVTIDAEQNADPATTAAALREQLDHYAQRHADYHATRRFLDEHPGRLDRMRAMPSFFDASGRTWLVSSWTNFGLYDIAFDGVKPELFCSLTAAPVPMMANLFESPNRAGLTLSVHLPTALARRADSPQVRARMHAHAA